MRKKREIVLFGLSSFINDLSSDMAASVLPAFIRSLGGSSSDITLIMGLREALPEMVKPLSGGLVDKTGKTKPFVVGGYLISSLSRVGMALSSGLGQLYLAVLGDRAGKGIRDSPRDLMISKLSKEESGKLYGIQKAMDTGGALLGSLLAVLLIGLMLPRDILLIAGAVGLLSFIPVMLVEEKKAKKSRLSFRFDRKMLPLMVFSFALANVGLPIALLSRNAAESVLLYAVFNISYIISSPFLGVLADRKGRKVGLFATYLAGALSFISFYIGEGILGMLLMGMSYGGMGSINRAVIADVVKSGKGSEGMEMSILSAVLGVATLLGSVAASLLVSPLGKDTFLIFSVLSLSAIPMLKAYL